MSDLSLEKPYTDKLQRSHPQALSCVSSRPSSCLSRSHASSHAIAKSSHRTSALEVQTGRFRHLDSLTSHSLRLQFDTGTRPAFGTLIYLRERI